MNVYEVLREAIISKKPCRIVKPGEPDRKACPYRLGKSAKGEENVLYYQYEGYTSRPGGLAPAGSSDNWRCNPVVRIETAVIVDELWHEPTVKPKSRGSCVVHLDVEVEGYYD